MSRLKRILAAGLVLALAGGALWAWRDAKLQQRQSRKAAWLGYLRGPLSDLLEGSSRGRELLSAAQRGPLSPAQSHELAQARAKVLASRDALSQAQPWMDDPFFEPLTGGRRWHAELAELAKDWPAMSRQKALIPEALVAEGGLRLNLAGALEAQRSAVQDRLKPSMELQLEANALIYALKE